MKQLIVSLLFVISIFSSGFSQGQEPQLTLNLIANDKIADVNVNSEKFIQSLKQVTEYCKEKFQDISKKQKIGILLIAHKSGKATFECYSNPKIDNKLKEEILCDLKKIEFENTKLVDFPIFISVSRNGKVELSDFVEYVDPIKKKHAEYEVASLETKIKLIKDYAINEAIPVLNAFQIIVDEKFEGVKNFGELIKETNFYEEQNIAELTSENGDYWRAIMEMNVGNQIIPLTKIFANASQGEFDLALKDIEIIRMFSDPKTIAHDYLEVISFQLNLFYQELHKEIGIGIVEHDKGNFKNAIKIYDELLAIYPNSSWALYEKYYSEDALSLADKSKASDDRSAWDNAKVEIYKHNPLYHMDVKASNGKEAYLLYRRQQTNTLFKKSEEKMKDVVKYAEIALDLGVYDFAAQLFWIAASFDPDNSQTAINYYLFCLDKLGEKELKSNFKGDFDQIFKTIEEKLDSDMKNSIFYKAMKN